MKHSTLALVIAAVLSGTVLIGCDQKDDDAAAQQQMPPAVVNVQTVTFETVPQVQTFSGRTTAKQTAEVRPQVSGIVDEILFDEGSNVQKGQPLYRINGQNYNSAIKSSEASIAQAKANKDTAVANAYSAQSELESRKTLLAQAQDDLQRLQGLVEIKAISEQQYSQAITARNTAQAAVQSAGAAIAQAQASIKSADASIAAAEASLDASSLDASRTIVRAPISGRTERSNVTVGTLVNASQADPMVTISSLNPIYVDISQSSSELLKLRQQIAEGKAQVGPNAVKLVLEDGSTYAAQGQLKIQEAKVDAATGAVTLRAEFPNNGSLLPGMFVNARLTQSVINNAVLLPQSAVTRTPKSETQVYIVDANNKIQVRPVTIEGTYNGNWIVTDGLQAGDKVVIIGGAKVKPEQEVSVQPLPSASAVPKATPTGAAPTAKAPQAKTPQQAAASN